MNQLEDGSEAVYAVDESGVYWADHGSGTVMKATK